MTYPIFTKLGVHKLWGEDPERMWTFMHGWLPTALAVIAPSAAYGGERVPEHGPAVVASNHFGTIDPPLIGIYSRRTIYYMTKVELVSLPVFGEILHWCGAFGIRRGEADRDALRVARWLLREGHMVGMFVEGTRQRLGHPGPVLPGGVMLAMQEGVPILPVGIETFGWRITNRKRCCVVFGEPFRLDHLPCTGKGYRQGAGILEPELHRLWRLASRAIADGFPDVLPDGTRRSKPMTWRTSLTVEARPWPDDEWAREPLGPIYRPNRYPAGPAATG
jgi:1-acyl-sn-glycerol-3-phosphate acyltransferase